MKVAIVSLRSRQKIHWVFKEIKKTTLKISQKNPDLVISVGGDGTFFEAERRYPGVPKLIVRQSQICHTCNKATFPEALRRIEQKEFFVREVDKLEVVGKKCEAVNDIVIRNKAQQEALRFSVNIQGKISESLLIGDGLVIATAFGSSGYFFAITRRTFAKGIGVAFNNIHNKNLRHIQIKDEIIRIKIIRGEATVTADNNRKTISIKERRSITVKKAKEKARIIDF